MLSFAEARIALENALPGATIRAWAIYKTVYLFRADVSDPIEAGWDPFYSVNIGTGEFREFSVFTDGDLSEIVELEWRTLE